MNAVAYCLRCRRINDVLTLYTKEPMNGPTRSLIGKTPHKRRRAIALASGRKNARVRSCAPWY